MTMTVKELIGKLEQYPEDLQVTVSDSTYDIFPACDVFRKNECKYADYFQFGKNIESDFVFISALDETVTFE